MQNANISIILLDDTDQIRKYILGQCRIASIGMLAVVRLVLTLITTQKSITTLILSYTTGAGDMFHECKLV